MEWRFRSGEQERGFTLVDSLVAIKPQPELFEFISHTQASDWQAGGPVTKEAEIALSTPYREIFARTGWVLVKATGPIASAAKTRIQPAGVKAVAQVAINEHGEPALTTDVLTVQLSDKLSEEKALGQLASDQLFLIRRLGFAPNLFEVRIPPGRSLPEVLSLLQMKTDIYVFAEPQLLEVIAGRSTPTDPEFKNQWQHNHLHSEKAWEVTRGQGIKLAVIDNGMEVTHPDLKDGIVGGGAFRLTGNTATFVRLNSGSDFPNVSHGTFCLGMAGARVNNSRGGCGSAPEAGLLAIACLKDQLGSQTTLARAIAYAADPTKEDTEASPSDGADIISCSLGPSSAWIIGPSLDLAITFAAKNGRGGRGSPIFWAVSDFLVDLSKDQVCSHLDVIAVGRSDQNNLRDVCAFGSRLAFLAPGREVLSTASGGVYKLGSGTSYAAPLAAGVAALLLAQHPDWTPQQVRDRLETTCDKIGGPAVVYDQGRNDYYGHGRLNAEQAVQ